MIRLLVLILALALGGCSPLLVQQRGQPGGVDEGKAAEVENQGVLLRTGLALERALEAVHARQVEFSGEANQAGAVRL